MNRRRIALALAAIFLSLELSADSQSFRLGRFVQIQNAILKNLERSYVDTLPIQKMEKAAIDAMLAELDPYTIYVPREENDDFRLMVQKKYGGIGAIIYKPDKDGNVIINEPYEGSPASLAGLRCADEILEIDGVSTHGYDTKECSDRMKGQPGTEVTFLVKKARTSDTTEVKIVRRSIHLPDIECVKMLEPGIGYIYQSGFTEDVSVGLRQAISELKAQGMKTLVYDLRGNGGGLLYEAVRIASIFLPKGTLVVTSKGRDKAQESVYRTFEEPIDTSMPVYLLVDGGSASASEIVTGALQDHKRATVLGKRTFGKGLVQSVVELPFGGELKMTTARYYTPSGRCVQAIDYASGEKAEDGGGLMPDVEVELPKYPDVVYSIVVGGLMEQYIIDYVRAHDDIADPFVFGDMPGFKAYVAPKLKNDEERKQLEEVDETLLRGFIEEEIVVRYRFQRAGAEVRLQYDTQLKKALEFVRR